MCEVAKELLQKYKHQVASQSMIVNCSKVILSCLVGSGGGVYRCSRERGLVGLVPVPHPSVPSQWGVSDEASYQRETVSKETA